MLPPIRNQTLPNPSKVLDSKVEQCHDGAIRDLYIFIALRWSAMKQPKTYLN